MKGNRLPTLNKLLFAADSVGSQAITQTRNLWLFFFLVTPAPGSESGLVPALDLGAIHLGPTLVAGLLLTAGRFIEAIDDPIIGWWSDRTRSRLGRRLPFILCATPFYALFFSLLWFAPQDGAGAVNAVYFFVVLELFFLATTMSSGPYEALLPELAVSHRDRMSIVAWWLYFGLLGAALGFVLSGPIKDLYGFQVMGGIVGATGLVFRYLGLSAVWKHAPRKTPAADIPLRSAFTGTLRNKQFLHFLPTYVLFQLAVGMLTAWLPFFVAGVLGSLHTWSWLPFAGGRSLGQGGTTSLLALVAVLGMMVGALALWKLSGRKTKRWVYSLSLLVTAAYLPIISFAGFIPVIPAAAQALVIAFFAGFPMAGVNLLPKAITADIADYDELLTGMRREGMYYAAQNLFEKIGSSFAPLLMGMVLLLGKTAADPLGIRLIGPVAGMLALLGYWMSRGYRLPDTVTRETVAEAGLDAGFRP